MQTVARQSSHPAFKTDVRVAEEDAHIAVFTGQGIAVGSGDQRPSNFHAEMVPVRCLLRESEHTAPPRAADIQMNGLFGSVEQEIRLRQLQRQLKEATQRIDVLAQGSVDVASDRAERMLSGRGSIDGPQQAPTGRVAMQMGGTADGSDFAIAEGSGHGQ